MTMHMRFLVAVLVFGTPAIAQLAEYQAEAKMTTDMAQTTLILRAVRPVPRGLLRLTEEYGWRLTFEEAPLSYSGDVVDMTSPSYHSKGPDDRALDPRSSVLTVHFPNPADPTSLRDEQNTVVDLLKAYADADLLGKYRLVVSSDNFLHVIPVEVRDSKAVLVPVTPLMDQRVSLPEDNQRTVVQAIQAVLTNISSTVGSKILLGGITDNRLNVPFPQKIDNMPAREVLDAIFIPLNIKCWTVLYDPGAKLHVLMIPLPALEKVVLRKMNE